MPVDLLWSAAPTPAAVPEWLQWVFLLGEPSQTVSLWWGGLLIWVKVVALFGLVGWLGAWGVAAIKERTVPRWLNAAALAGLMGGVVAVVLLVMESETHHPGPRLGSWSIADVLTAGSEALLALWAAWALWSTVLRVGNRYDAATLAGLSVALGVGLFAGFAFKVIFPNIDPITAGLRLGATFMGYAVLVRILGLLGREVIAVRPRRLQAIAWQTVVEANRRMWAPWVVLAIFLFVLAFIHWYLAMPRPAELGRLYVRSLTWLISLLLTVMVVFLTPISLPNDISQQTIYTIVSKPVRRIELIWGRMIGFMVLVTALLVVFGGVSLAYLNRTISTTITATRQRAEVARRNGNTTGALNLDEQADQMLTRMAARVPIKGSLVFFDSKGAMKKKGIDVGMEMQFRSHIEGATRALALWRFDVVPDPIDENIILDRRVPVSQLLKPGTMEDIEDQLALAKNQEAAGRKKQAEGGRPVEVRRLAEALPKLRDRIQELSTERIKIGLIAADVERRAREAEAAKQPGQAQALRDELAALHSPPIPLEMTFNIFRTTKGRVIGQAVHAELKARNLQTGEVVTRLFPVREYYTNPLEVPSKILVGSGGRVAIEVRCLSPQQYIGMAEGDLYILQSRGSFATNYLKGLSGIWLQAMVLTAIGVWAGTFLSWPVALLMTIFFFIAGQVAFGFLQEFAMHSLVGGGPFESLIRLLMHENMQNNLQATPAVLTAKTLDALFTPVMARLVYIVPNFAGMDVSNTVSEGFDIDRRVILDNFLMAIAYAFPFSVAGYFLLKNREVAA